MDTEKNVFAPTGFRFLPFLAFCLLIGVPRQTAWLYEGHSEIELREMKASQPSFQAKPKKRGILLLKDKKAAHENSSQQQSIDL